MTRAPAPPNAAPPEPVSVSAPAPRLNTYVLRAVTELNAAYAGLGYGSAAFTHDLKFGDHGIMSASHPPQTMCVAAQLEVLITALDLYAMDTQDYSAFAFLPKPSWERLHPADFRGKVWMVKGADSNGAADALEHFGMGTTTSFETAQPGDFINFNRVNGSGHGVVFLSYLDSLGNELPAYGPAVAGFKYFSSQGKPAKGGLGYGYAFFNPVCPTLPADHRRDCWVIRSVSAHLLGVGYAQLPSSWNHAIAAAALAAPTANAEEGTFNAEYFTGVTTDD